VLSSATDKADMTGVIGGGQFGYNWQVFNWVYGWETDFQGSGQKGNPRGVCAGGGSADAAVNSACAPGHVGDTDPFNVGAFPVTSTLTQRLEWFGTLRGRAGYTVTPTFLVYGTAGMAYGQVKITNTVSGTNVFGVNGTDPSTLVSVAGSSSNSVTNVGWAAGTGIESMLGGRWIEHL
jgi:outer membrane immunogenic protein